MPCQESGHIGVTDLIAALVPCDKTYVGETGIKFGVRLQEHRTEVEAKTTRTFTRSQRVSSLSEHNKSALTDHGAQENHMINWSKAMVIDREPVRFSRWIKEAVHIRKEGQHTIYLFTYL